MIITENQIINQIQEFLTDCDTDELARLAGELFGGKCYSYFDPDANTPSNLYDFEPDENYCGAFD